MQDLRYTHPGVNLNLHEADERAYLSLLAAWGIYGLVCTCELDPIWRVEWMFLRQICCSSTCVPSGTGSTHVSLKMDIQLQKS